MQNYVFVLDTNKVPQAPIHPAAARLLLREGKAAVFRRFPFTIILKEAVENPIIPSVTMKIDPGSKVSGIALVQGGRVIFAAELEHRGRAIKDALDKRRALRQGRRSRKTRYRPARFLNRTHPKDWLAPSLKSRVDNVQTWFIRFFKLCNVQSISMELVRFDTQLMKNAEISGVEYQQGELAGYEVREYLLEKFQRKCCYCGGTDCPLEVEHIVPKSRGGTNQITNLCLACRKCNQAKNNQTATEFGYPEVEAQAKRHFRDAAAVNATRWAMLAMLRATGIPVEVGTGGRTKFNRTRQNYPKLHWVDAACVGESGQAVKLDSGQQPLRIRAVGHGNRQMCQTNKYGNAICHRSNNRTWKGWKTGDMAKAIIGCGKYAGAYPAGRVTAKQNNSFKFATVNGPISVNCKYLHRVHRKDGYSYTVGDKCP